MENINNLAVLCKECSDEKKKKFRKNFDKYILEVGYHVKKEFKEKGKTSEHMWIKILSLTENGILDNEPFFLEKIKLGDKVFINFNEIEDYSK